MRRDLSNQTKQDDRQKKRDKRLIKRKLGLSLDNPLPKCPAQSRARVKELEEYGDYTHSDKKHFCHICGCRNTAGFGTDHLGYGFCFRHERKLLKRKSPQWIDWMNLKHRDAIVSRHPGAYRHIGRFSEMIRREGEEAEQTISLIDELRIARGMVQETILANQGQRLNDRGQVEPLTERVNGKLLPMSDATRIQLMTRLFTSIRTLSATQFALTKDDVITLDQFKVWFARFWTSLKGALQQYQTGHITDVRELEHTIATALKQLGDPRTITPSHSH